MTTPPRDLTAERAAKQYTMNDLFKLAMEGKVNIVEDRFVSTAALKTARQEALREAARVAKQAKDDCALGRVREAYDYVIARLDRLASEGG